MGIRNCILAGHGVLFRNVIHGLALAQVRPSTFNRMCAFPNVRDILALQTKKSQAHHAARPGLGNMIRIQCQMLTRTATVKIFQCRRLSGAQPAVRTMMARFAFLSNMYATVQLMIILVCTNGTFYPQAYLITFGEYLAPSTYSYGRSLKLQLAIFHCGSPFAAIVRTQSLP